MRTTFDRRRFLLLGAGGAAAAIAGGGSAGAADPEFATVWRLSADWGYPVPPKSRTRCLCSACRAHAANKIYLSRDEAIAGRIHPCCVCQPYSIQLLTTDVAALAALTTAGSADLRTGPVRTAFEDAVARAQEPPPPPPIEAAPTTTTTASTTSTTSTTTAPTTTAPTTSAPATTSAPGTTSPTIIASPPANPRDVDASSSNGRGELPAHAAVLGGSLPLTGTDPKAIGAIATAAMFAGAAAIGLARRPASGGSTDEQS